jgi:hypothetical protein
MQNREMCLTLGRNGDCARERPIATRAQIGCKEDVPHRLVI